MAVQRSFLWEYRLPAVWLCILCLMLGLILSEFFFPNPHASYYTYLIAVLILPPVIFVGTLHLLLGRMQCAALWKRIAVWLALGIGLLIGLSRTLLHLLDLPDAVRMHYAELVGTVNISNRGIITVADTVQINPRHFQQLHSGEYVRVTYLRNSGHVFEIVEMPSVLF